MNLVDLIKGQINEDVLGKLGRVTGQDLTQTRTAVNAAVPAMLGGLAGLASSGDGASRLASSLDGQEPATLSNFGNMLGGQGDVLAGKGTSMLSSLFGESALSNLVAALSKFLGGNAESISKLLGAIAPMIMGVLGSQKRGLGLNSTGLSKMLAEQRNNIMSAMPSGLSSALSGVSGFGNLLDAAKTGIPTAVNYSQRAASSAGGPLKWVVLIAIIALLGYLGWQYFGKPDQKGVVDGAKNLMSSADVTKFTGDIKSTLISLAEVLGSVKDEASADAALPKLTETSTKLDGFKSMMDKVPAAEKSGITTLIKDNLKGLKDAIDKIVAMPVIGDKLKSILGDITSKLTALSA